MNPLLIGPLAAVIGVLGFSFKAILIKLAYAWAPIDAVSLLALRMIYSAPFFALMAWWATRRSATPIGKRDWLHILWLGFIGYYLASLVDFMGLQYVSASLERLMLYLYPTLVVVLSAVLLKQRITGRIMAWAMLASTAFVLLQFALTRPMAALAAPLRIQLLSLTMAVLSTVLPTFLIAEAIRRIGANRTSLVGSLGPVFTIWLGWWLLAEPVHWIQLGGVALVLAGVTLVTLRPRAAERKQSPL